MNSTVKFLVNGAVVAEEQFSAKTQARLDRAVGRYKSQVEFIIRATLWQSGAGSATIDICEDAHEIQYRWTATEGIFGTLGERKILRW